MRIWKQDISVDILTAVQVDTRRDRTVAEMLDEWNEISPAVEEIAPMFGPATGQWLFDACTHEHDLRNALGTPGARDSDAVALGFEWSTDRVDDVLRSSDAPALTFHTEAGAKTGRPGGFWTPATMFDGRYIERLTRHAGLTFQIC